MMESASSLFWKHAMNGSKIKEINYEIEAKKLLHAPPPLTLGSYNQGWRHSNRDTGFVKLVHVL